MATEFENDDTGYLAWLGHNPEGFVINCNANPSPNYVTVHRATCHTINGTPTKGTEWTVLYRKVCGDTVSDLDRWAADNVATHPHRCGSCQP
jgi:hypothetical protein